MASGVKTMIDLGLQAQLARLRRLAEIYKDRAIDEVRQKAISLGITAALAIVGLLFLLIALLVGLAALYLWVAQQYGPFAGLGAVGGLAFATALILFAIMALRGGGSGPRAAGEARFAVTANNTSEPIEGALRSAVKATDEMTGRAKETVEAVERAGAAARDALDDAVSTIRHGSRPALLATIAGTVMLGVILGRRH